jgi:putative FmdB family regulatory protein
MGALTDWDLLDIRDLWIAFESLIGRISRIDTAAYTPPDPASLLPPRLWLLAPGRLLPGALSAIRSAGKAMPTYEYRCEKCKETFEMFQSMKDDALQVCPKEHCRLETWGEGKVKRLLGAGAGLIFKGSGFYITDYRSQSYSEAAKKESGSKESGGAKTDSSPSKTTKEKSSSGSGSKSES